MDEIYLFYSQILCPLLYTKKCIKIRRKNPDKKERIYKLNDLYKEG